MEESLRNLQFAVLRSLDLSRQTFNRRLGHLEAWQIVAVTVLITLVLQWIYRILFGAHFQPLSVRLKAAIFKAAKRLPFVKRRIDAELAKTRLGLEEEMHKLDPTKAFYRRLPGRNLSESEILTEVDRYAAMGHYKWSEGSVSGCVYGGEPALTRLVSQVYEKFAWTNPLHPDVFPGVRKMEAEIVRMVCDLFHGDSETCGTLNSGGTESIMLACLAYRNLAYSRGIEFPEMILPESAHAAFDKAADAFRIVVVRIPIDKRSFKANVGAIKRAVSKNTCMIVASAPGFPHGIVDDAEEIAKLGQRYNVPVHVDACLGGFLIVFMEDAGFPLPTFDFRLPGVTSISCDTHKYGYTTKGSSVVLYRNFGYLKLQFFSQPDWPGGIYATPSFAGSRCGANIATTWASLLFHGRRGYVEATRAIISTARHITEQLRLMDGIFVLGEPEVSVVAFSSHVYSVYAISDLLNAKGWNLNLLQFPTAIHFCITKRQTFPGIADRFLNDMRAIVRELKACPGNPSEGKAAMYGMAQSIPDRSLVNEFAHEFIRAFYNTDPPGSKAIE